MEAAGGNSVSCRSFVRKFRRKIVLLQRNNFISDGFFPRRSHSNCIGPLQNDSSESDSGSWYIFWSRSFWCGQLILGCTVSHRKTGSRLYEVSIPQGSFWGYQWWLLMFSSSATPSQLRQAGFSIDNISQAVSWDISPKSKSKIQLEKTVLAAFRSRWQV